MYKKGIKFIFGLLLINIFSFIGMDRVNAASASISVSVNKSTVIVGSTVTATVTVSSKDEIGSWFFDVGYDSSKLQFVSSSFQDRLNVQDVYTAIGQKTKTYTFTFKAIQSGSASISTKNAGVYDIPGTLMSVSTGSKSVKVMTQAELEASYSKNNYLKSLNIEGATLSPEFNKDTLEYTVELEPETTSIKVNATKEDSKASVTGTGDITVSEGDNKINVVVTAENGNERTYVINAKVKELSPIVVKLDNKEYSVIRKKEILNEYMPQQTYKETIIKINDEDVPAFESDITKFILVGLKDKEGNISLYIYDGKKDIYTKYREINTNRVLLYPMNFGKDVTIPDGYKKYTIKIGEDKIDAYKLSKGSHYSIIYGMNIETGKKGLYLYDDKEETLQRYYKEEVEKLNEKFNIYNIILLSSLGLIVILCIILIILSVKLIKRKNKIVQKEESKITRKDPRNKKED